MPHGVSYSNTRHQLATADRELVMVISQKTGEHNWWEHTCLSHSYQEVQIVTGARPKSPYPTIPPRTQTFRVDDLIFQGGSNFHLGRGLDESLLSAI